MAFISTVLKRGQTYLVEAHLGKYSCSGNQRLASHTANYAPHSSERTDPYRFVSCNLIKDTLQRVHILEFSLMVTTRVNSVRLRPPNAHQIHEFAPFYRIARKRYSICRVHEVNFGANIGLCTYTFNLS